MKTIAMKIEQLDGLTDTADVTPWENAFITSIVSRMRPDKDTRWISDKQVDIIERIWEKHFA